MREEDPFPKWVAPSGGGPDIKRAEETSRADGLLAPCLLVSISEYIHPIVFLCCDQHPFGTPECSFFQH